MKSWDEIAIDGKVTFPFPTEPLEITFGLTDVTAPDAVIIKFAPPDMETIGTIQSDIMASVGVKAVEAEQITRGMGGDATVDAIKALYRDQIDAQTNVSGLLQHYMDEAVRIRYRMEILRQMAAQIVK